MDFLFSGSRSIAIYLKNMTEEEIENMMFPRISGTEGTFFDIPI